MPGYEFGKSDSGKRPEVPVEEIGTSKVVSEPNTDTGPLHMYKPEPGPARFIYSSEERPIPPAAPDIVASLDQSFEADPTRYDTAACRELGITKEVCEGCGHRIECLGYGVTIALQAVRSGRTVDRKGMRGALTDDQRAELIQMNRPELFIRFTPESLE